MEPRWLKLARTDLGIRETPGIANNPVLMKRFSSITKMLGVVYNADSVPWCGAQMAWWMSQCGIAAPAIAIRAKSWAGWGTRLERGCPGAVLVFDRKGGGHVGLYVGEDETHFHVLGGNQGDRISIARIAKAATRPGETHCIAIRWPTGEPGIGVPVRLSASGAPVSRSEA